MYIFQGYKLIEVILFNGEWGRRQKKAKLSKTTGQQQKHADDDDEPCVKSTYLSIQALINGI